MFALVAGGSLQGQFAQVQVELDLARLNEAGRQECENLDREIRNFFLHSPWDQGIRDLEIFLDIQLVFQTDISAGNERLYQAQALFTNRLDQQYFTRNVQFSGSRGRGVRLASIFDPLGSFLEFYAYLMIAGELDTYDPLGGSAYYSKAAALTIQGKNSRSTSRGWEERSRLVERLSSNQDLRRAKAYFYLALENYSQLSSPGQQSESDNAAWMKELRQNLQLFHQAIQQVVRRLGQERYTGIFLSGHAAESAEMLLYAGMREQLAAMIELDPNNIRLYQDYLTR